MLTDTKCKAAAPRDKLYLLADGSGLYLEIKPNGVKAWCYRFEIKGKESFFAFGEYVPVSNKESLAQAEDRRVAQRFTLQEARKERARCRDLVRQGVHPVNAPVCSPQSTSMAESFVTMFKRDYVSRMGCRDAKTVKGNYMLPSSTSTRCIRTRS